MVKVKHDIPTVCKWQNHIDGFITKVQQPAQMPSMETLIDCRAGLTRKIFKEESSEKVAKLRAIRDEIDFLIESL